MSSLLKAALAVGLITAVSAPASAEVVITPRGDTVVLGGTVWYGSGSLVPLYYPHYPREALVDRWVIDLDRELHSPAACRAFAAALQADEARFRRLERWSWHAGWEYDRGRDPRRSTLRTLARLCR